MPVNNGVNPATHFGKQVRKARQAKGWSIHELALRTEFSAGYLSRIENGKQQPTEKVAVVMDAVFSEREGWFCEYYRDSQAWTPPGYRHWTEHETGARSLRIWTVGVVHGLAQTERYADAHLNTAPGVPAAVVKTRLAARMERQRRVLHRDDPPSVWLLVDELALFRMMGSEEIMTEQMDHLLALAEMSDVALQVVPAVGHAATGSEIVVTDTAAYVEHQAGGYVYTEPETVTALGRLITTIQTECYRTSESVRLIERVRDIWATGESPLTALLRADRASK